eukprot:GHVL01037661.1.p1 GENE.GHVL01037661.1~~GHVL01037661.1.p1  ORF type:complete len:198 (+),score=37.79 GHVL01037661.1:41-634(+)
MTTEKTPDSAKRARTDSVDSLEPIEQLEVSEEHCDKPRIYDSSALNRKLEEIRYKIPEGLKRVPFLDTLAVINDIPRPSKIGKNDDLKREATFHKEALENVAEAYRRFSQLEVPASRPDDFLAEMLKPDYHMQKVRRKMLDEQKRIKVVESRKAYKEQRKISRKTKGQAKQHKASCTMRPPRSNDKGKTKKSKVASQ